MSFKLSFEIAKTHLISRMKQTIIAMLGVTFGISMFIAMVSLMTGLNDFTEELTMTSTPDIHIYNDIKIDRKSIIEEVYPAGINLIHSQKPKKEKLNIKDAFQITEVLSHKPEILGVSPTVSSQAFFNYGPIQLNGQIIGVDIIEEDKLFDLKSKMKEGTIEELKAASEGIIMGSGLAKKLSAKKGDRVVVTTPQGTTITLKIVGIFQMGIGVVDNIRSYANISTVQKILGVEKSYITDINIKLKDLTQAKAHAEIYQNQFGYKAEDWETANATMLVGMVIRNILTYSVSITLLIVAGFGIYNILTMAILSKMKDIAILKATGFGGGDVKSIFMIQSVVIGFLGSLLGLAIGFTLSYMIAQVPFDGGDFISIDRLPVNFKMKYYIIGIVFGVTTTALAGYFPSIKAAKVDPIEIIRGN
jgi:lipoprotein-releasing system permease protein